MKGHVDEGALPPPPHQLLFGSNPTSSLITLDIKRQSVIACAYCIIVLEYDSKKAMWCKMLRG